MRIITISQVLQDFEALLFRVAVKSTLLKIDSIFKENYFNLLALFKFIDALSIYYLLWAKLFHQILIKLIYSLLDWWKIELRRGSIICFSLFNIFFYLIYIKLTDNVGALVESSMGIQISFHLTKPFSQLIVLVSYVLGLLEWRRLGVDCLQDGIFGFSLLDESIQLLFQKISTLICERCFYCNFSCSRRRACIDMNRFASKSLLNALILISCLGGAWDGIDCSVSRVIIWFNFSFFIY